ncbi:MAG: bifunctional (p)ppGpp synthetase/guanosine-3',5'-bis(diphosphate) 3'-pyrophosphohydrolase [Lentimicrobiaceae bacterium]|nr:bifunctional (p)ppGpp synthetase/guanosine-3',5'-bis(diphosphate) 3'-pyrophosphohydrolase [Lentimicrobiaceae bacterium]
MVRYTDKERELIEVAFGVFIRSVGKVMDSEQIGYIEKAYRLALEKYDGKKTLSGGLFILSLIEMADIAVNEIGLRSKTIVGIFLHGIMSESDVTIDYIREHFGERIAMIVEGYDKISNIQTNKVSFQSEQFRRLYLSLIEDIRVILIKIIHLLYDMRHREDVDYKYFKTDLKEVKYLCIPITHRLGLYDIKKEFEEKVMIYEYPVEYEEIQNKIRVSSTEQERLMENFLAPIRKALQEEHIDSYIKWRTKSVSSIYEKMKTNNLPFEQIFDIFAVRIIIKNSKPSEEKSDCWRVYSIVTNIYQPNPKRLRDWITTPKVSGYESLHTTVQADKNWIEVQIRTERMDEVAEKGSAAHWQYKGRNTKQTTDEWLNQVREILESPQYGKLDDRLSSSCKSDKIYVFTPNGDLKQLPVGATVLDFAFDIHTQLGSCCAGANVNGKLQPIRYELHSGDRVEVLTNKKQSPKADWLNVVTTDKAKARIKRYLKDQEMKEAELGSALFYRRLKNWKITYTDRLLSEILKEYNLSSGIEFYHLIATEKIDIARLKEFILSLNEEKDVKIDKLENETVKEKSIASHEGEVCIGNNMSDLAYRVAKCCNPIPGEKVLGFISINGGVTIHRANCNNVKALLKNYPYRIIEVKWNNESSAASEIVLKIVGDNEFGLLSTISNVIKDLHINILNANFETKESRFVGKLVLQVGNTNLLEQLLRKLKSLKGVSEVQRIS